MGIFSKLLGGQSSESGDSDSNESESFDPDFSFAELADATRVEVDEAMASLIQARGEESFPDNEGVRYVTEQVMEVEGKTYAEVIPDDDIGYSQFVFVINSGNTLVACYCYEDGAYTLLFT